MRFLIFLGLLILLYYLVKGWIFPSKPRPTKGAGGQRALDSEMVRDPHCKTYIPKDSAVRSHIAGREYHFCSRECMRRFKDKIKEDGGE